MQTKNKLLRNIILLVATLYVSALAHSNNTKKQEPSIVDSGFIYKINKIVLTVAPYTSVSEIELDSLYYSKRDNEKQSIAQTQFFAAKEIKAHLAMMGIDVKIIFSKSNYEVNENAIIFELPLTQLKHKDPENQSYSITNIGSNLAIKSSTAVGILYGAYGLLESMGFNWYSELKVSTPRQLDFNLKFEQINEPKIKFRGFWLFPKDELSKSYTLWLVRNRFNLVNKSSKHDATLYGFYTWTGGHHLITEEYSKKGLYESNPDWYPEYVKNQKRPIAADDHYTNPSFASKEGAYYFADRLVQRLESGDLKNVDIINIWPSDYRKEQVDLSDKALKLGNFTDNLLYYYVNIAERLNQAFLERKLSRKVYLGGISYQTSWTPPTNLSIVKELENKDYIHIFYPIGRDWRFSVNEPNNPSKANTKYSEQTIKWKEQTNLSFGLTDYNNLSLYGGLAISDYLNFAKNFDFFLSKNGTLLAYMHPLNKNTGPLALTNFLMSKLSWVADDDNLQLIAKKAIKHYFKSNFRDYSKSWSNIYEEHALAVSNANNIFGEESLQMLLFQNIYWADPAYTYQESLKYIDAYIIGGRQLLPNGYYHRKYEDDFYTTFIGLEESVNKLGELKKKYKRILSRVNDKVIENKMLNDIAFFDVSFSRYKLMLEMAKFYKTGNKKHAINVRKEFSFLRKINVLDNVISELDQRYFIQLAEKIINDRLEKKQDN